MAQVESTIGTSLRSLCKRWKTSVDNGHCMWKPAANAALSAALGFRNEDGSHERRVLSQPAFLPRVQNTVIRHQGYSRDGYDTVGPFHTHMGLLAIRGTTRFLEQSRQMERFRFKLLSFRTCTISTGWDCVRWILASIPFLSYGN
jgi:hypothetical protein